MNDHDRAHFDELSTLAEASVQRALDARQEITPLSAEQTDLVGGGLPTISYDFGALRVPIWYGMWLPRPYLNSRF